MSDVERLLSDYITEHRAGGEADPIAYLEQLEGIDRAELGELIDAYLSRSPGREWNPEAYQGSAAELLSDRLTRSLGGVAGLWPVILPRLREREQLVRADLVSRLAEELGVGGRRDKVDAYYHQMEQGRLPSEGVSPAVLEKLGALVGTSADFLRAAGRSLGGAGRGRRPSPAFTRVRAADADSAAASSVEATAGRAEEEDAAWDEVDELFRGG